MSSEYLNINYTTSTQLNTENKVEKCWKNQVYKKCTLTYKNCKAYLIFKGEKRLTEKVVKLSGIEICL